VIAVSGRGGLPFSSVSIHKLPLTPWLDPIMEQADSASTTGRIRMSNKIFVIVTSTDISIPNPQHQIILS
jgi:hypothetical protein